MLNSGAKKKINILTLALSEKKFMNETKNHNPPPLQVKWSFPYMLRFVQIRNNRYNNRLIFLL
jgi:hypothetical protein